MVEVLNENQARVDEFCEVQAKFCPVCFSGRNRVLTLWHGLLWVGWRQLLQLPSVTTWPALAAGWNMPLGAALLPDSKQACGHLQVRPGKMWCSPLAVDFYLQNSAVVKMQKSPPWFVGRVGISVLLYLTRWTIVAELDPTLQCSFQFLMARSLISACRALKYTVLPLIQINPQLCSLVWWHLLLWSLSQAGSCCLCADETSLQQIQTAVRPWSSTWTSNLWQRRVGQWLRCCLSPGWPCCRALLPRRGCGSSCLRACSAQRGG